MTRLEKMIGFPVPQEHRKELNERLNTYENCDRTTLISLLLQYDWELLQMQNNAQEKITLEVFRTKPSAEEMKVAAQKFHDAVEKMNDAVKKMNDAFRENVSCRFCKFYENHCPLSVGYEERNNGLLFCYPNRICDNFEFREEQ